MTTRRAVLVANPKASGGADRRTESLEAVLASLGFAVDVIQPTISRRRPPSPTELWLLAHGEIVPEALSWNVTDVETAIVAIDPDVVVLQTARAVHPLLTTSSARPTIVVDLVDQLSSSYRQRAAQAGHVAATGFRLLASCHQRFEERLGRRSGPILAAGYREAASMGVTWIPNVIDPPTSNRPSAAWTERPYDAVFFGTLSYQPNVEAIHQLAKWSQALHWGGTILIAGRHPTAEVTRICVANDWTLVPDFPSTDWLIEQARVAIAPLRSTAGIQNKVLEAGQIGQPQVVTTAALAGMDPDMPLRGADDAETFFGQLDRLLACPAEAQQQVLDVQDYLRTNLVAGAVAPRLQAVLVRSEDRIQTNLNEGSR